MAYVTVNSLQQQTQDTSKYVQCTTVRDSQPELGRGEFAVIE